MNAMTKKRNRFDVVVVGAGPAGSTAAYLLASNGFDVLMVDKSSFPRNKLCGGLLTLKTVKLLEDIFKLSADWLKNKRIITYQSFDYKLASSKGESIEGRMDYPFYFVQRSVYDALWLEMAQKAGVEYRAGEKVVALDVSINKVTTDRGGECFGNYILGADGAVSRIRRSLSAAGFINPDRPLEMAKTLEVFIPNRHVPEPAECPSIYFGHIPWGYTWSFPGEDFRILGLAGLSRKADKSFKACFRRFLESLNISMQEVPHLKSHALPYGNYLSRPGYGKVLLLGDACGLADPLLGEGIYYAHKSALLAAQAILNSSDNAQAVFEIYKRLLGNDIIAEFRPIRMLRQVIFSLPGNWPYKILSFILRMMPNRCEEALHGLRSVRCFRQGSFFSWQHKSLKDMRQ
jgi:geranylgeranyl reductase family protein